MNEIEVIARLNNPADYEEYKAECLRHKALILPLMPYSHTMGMVLMGMHKYPDIPPYEAFMKVQQEANKAMEQPVQQPQAGQPVKTGCGSCGGGKTR